MIRIAVDAMGGDHAPEEIIKGAALAAEDYQIILVGPEFLRDQLPRGVTLVEACEWIGMDEQPAVALRRKRNSSLMVAANLVREGKADAFVSAGNSGAAMGAALLRLGRIPGIGRPAIAIPLPTTIEKPCLILDAGANVDCTEENLLQFARMGANYYQAVFNEELPRVGLLSIGEEEGKGNQLTRAAHKLLAESDLNFIGNIEGRDLTAGTAQVAVCDGFVGNIVLKLAEGMASSIFKILKEEVKKSWLRKMGMSLARPALKSLASRFDYAEYGGAPLLGVDGVVMISHGRSKARAILSSINNAAVCVEKQVVQKLKEVK
jgi:glycerol-3-phosphate acyltransferase PlsX